MELILWYGKLLEQDCNKKYNVSEKSDNADMHEARYNYLCEVLDNSSFFEEDSNEEDEKCNYLFPQKHFVSKYGRIVTGIVMPCWWPDISDNTYETYLFGNPCQDLIGLIVKAFGENYGLEIHSRTFFWDKDIFLLLADNQEEVDKFYDWVKKDYFEHKESMKRLQEKQKAEEEKKKAKEKREKEWLKKQMRKDPEYKKKKWKLALMISFVLLLYLYFFIANYTNYL